VTFSTLKFTEAIKHKAHGHKVPVQDPADPQEPLRLWTDGVPRIAQSADGVDILLHLPNALSETAHVRMHTYYL
jgi:hypothetical protein